MITWRRRWMLKFGYVPEQINRMTMRQMHRLAPIDLLAAIFGGPEVVVIPLTKRGQQRLRDAVFHVLGELTDTESCVLRLRHGIDCTPHTLPEVGAIFGRSGERVRAIQCKALRKLKHPCRSYHLFPFVVRAA